MKTQKPVAGISYNTPEFLKQLIQSWYENGIISFGAFIQHKGESIGGDLDKDHIHVFLEPAQQVQTLLLEHESYEIPENSIKPLKVLGLSSSKFDDWCLYTLHDPQYCVEKGLEKQYHYSLEEYWCTDDDTFNYKVSMIAETRKAGMLEARIVQMINNGMNWEQILRSGLIPIRFIYPAKIVYDSLYRPPCERFCSGFEPVSTDDINPHDNDE